jgi:hypothetical protein
VHSVLSNPDAAHKDNTQWSVLWEGNGYIVEFHRTMKTMDENQQELLKQGLHKVFLDLHCLPASDTRVWTQKNDAIIFMTNPTFYKIDCIERGGESQKRAPRACCTMKLIKGKHIFAADLMDSQPFNANGNLQRKTEKQKQQELQRKTTMAKKKEPSLPHIIGDHFP